MLCCVCPIYVLYERINIVKVYYIGMSRLYSYDKVTRVIHVYSNLYNNAFLYTYII